jgi:HlyD family secretion protein
VAETERELERVVLQATALLVDFEAEVNTEKAKLELEETELADLNEQIAHGKLYAPKSGMVVYARESGDRYGRDDPIAEGTEVRERQELITIPSTGGMVAEVSLHESVLKQVAAGLDCTVRVDAIPGVEFHGQVAWVALLPDQNSWWANPNQRLYRTEVHIEDATEEMRPGMSCSVEILVEDIADALYAPVQAVVRHRGDNIAFVSSRALPARYEVRPVVVGSYNDRWVEIESGLEEGETVLLAPPPDFVTEAEARAQAEAAAEEAPPAVPPAVPPVIPPAPAPGAGSQATPAAASPASTAAEPAELPGAGPADAVEPGGRPTARGAAEADGGETASSSGSAE